MGNNVFEDAEITEELPTSSPDIEESGEEEWAPQISGEAPKDRKERVGEKKNSDGKVLTVKSVFFTKPKTKDRDGKTISPKKTLDEKKEYYPGKLGIKFEEDNLVEYYPNFHYFVNEDGKISNLAKINRGGDNSVSKIFKLVVAKLGKPEDEVSDAEVFKYLVGKKVKIKTESGTYLGKKWFRNDIAGFI
jgi:hypothetical protein